MITDRTGNVCESTSVEVWGIVTHGDVHKAPANMRIFCLISLGEMRTLRIIRDRYPYEEWRKYVFAFVEFGAENVTLIIPSCRTSTKS